MEISTAVGLKKMVSSCFLVALVDGKDTLDASSPDELALVCGAEVPTGTNVFFYGFLWSSPSACLPFCL